MPNIISRIFSTGSDRELRNYQARLKDVEAFAGAFAAMDDEELQLASTKLRKRAKAGDPLDALLPEAFALVREASSRVLGLRHYDVQLIGAMALHDGHVAEMATGEGKTLAATAAAYLNALAGEPVHVVTVNDYLAKRDCEWMRGVYAFLGTSVGLIQAGMRQWQRKAAYAADITYGTNSELGFDYLRDNMARSTDARVQRGQGFAIVDEADSILIDGARTPLIISGRGETSIELYQRFAEIARALDPEDDVIIDGEKRIVYASERGLDKVEKLLGEEVYSDASGRLANHLRQALRARFTLKRDVDYVVKDGEVRIVDEFTGRILEGRRYSEGLHQAVEAKEGVSVLAESMTMATVTLQNFFRLYAKLSGMTGTALTEDSEFRDVYKMRVVSIPTNRPVVRKDGTDLVFRTEEAKYSAVADEVERRHAAGQPVLVGTTSVKNSMRLSGILEARGIPHNVLNALNHEAEARVVAQAGRRGAVTISTNMAGRGTDIHLGGSYDFLKTDCLGNYLVLDPSKALDWQVSSAEAEARYIVEREGYEVREEGGLCVIGTERHESRRVDNQLRGRAGRQGDPGESRFYLSLEDELLVRFGGDRLRAVSDMMEKRGLGDDAPIEDVAVAKVINAAQREVEAAHLAQRKFVLDFDDVMNRQRLAVYRERNAILDGKKDFAVLIPEIVKEATAEVVAFYCPASVPSDDWNLDPLCAWYTQMTGSGAEWLLTVDHGDEPETLASAIEGRLGEILEEKREGLGNEAFAAVASGSMLQMLDAKWLQHLHDMDRLRQGIMLRAVGRREPLLEFKEESYEAFGELVASVYEDWLNVLLRLNVETDHSAAGDESVEEMAASQGEVEARADFSPVTDNPLG